MKLQKSKKTEHKFLIFQSEPLIPSTIRRKMLCNFTSGHQLLENNASINFFKKEAMNKKQKKETITTKAFLKSCSVFPEPHSNAERK